MTDERRISPRWLNWIEAWAGVSGALLRARYDEECAVIDDREIACFGVTLHDVRQRRMNMIPAPTNPPVKTPLTDRFEQYTSALEGSAMTQTYWDCAPRLPMFEMAVLEEPSARARQEVAATRYVEINERRPARFYDEKKYHGKATLAGGVVIADGTVTEAYDHNHFELSTLAAIVKLIGGSVGRRAEALMHSAMQLYIRQPGAYLSLESPR